jgi:tetratricopeptide (TPR) repeat protein
VALRLLSLAQQREETLPAEARFRLSMALGDYYRQTDMWAEAIPYYEAAWSQFPDHARLAEYLGRSYNRVGRFQESATVLEQGLADLPPGAERPILVANYLIDLGTSQEALGDHERACFAFRHARSAIEAGAALITAQQSTQILARIALLSDSSGCPNDGSSP